MKNQTNKQILTRLRKLGACDDAKLWCRDHGGSLADLWRDCQRGDWMAWLANRTRSITHLQLVGALADCAELSLHFYEEKFPDDNRVRDCIETCKRYAAGKASRKELDAAASASWSASYAAAYAAASASYAASADASWSAAYAVYSADASASYAASADASASYAASADAARMKLMNDVSDIFRKYFQVEPLRQGMN